MFLATLNLDRDARRLLLLLAVAIGVASALLAMLQVLGGSDSGLYFFRFTNPGKGVGFFANSNHFGAFEYILLPLGAAALAETPTRSSAFLLAVLGGDCACAAVWDCAVRLAICDRLGHARSRSDARVFVDPRVRKVGPPSLACPPLGVCACDFAAGDGFGFAANPIAVCREGYRRGLSLALRRQYGGRDIELLSIRRGAWHVSERLSAHSTGGGLNSRICQPRP